MFQTSRSGDVLTSGYMAVRKAVFLEVLLMIVFGTIKGLHGLNLSDNRVSIASGLGKFLFGSRCQGMLVCAVIKDDRPILSADVRTLAISCSGVMHFPERVE